MNRRRATTVAVWELSPRVAHVMHALLVRWDDAGEAVSAAQVCEYDAEALTEASTTAALAHARRLGLADGFDRVWYPTELARDVRGDLEARFRAEVESGGAGDDATAPARRSPARQSPEASR